MRLWVGVNLIEDYSIIYKIIDTLIEDGKLSTSWYNVRLGPAKRMVQVSNSTIHEVCGKSESGHQWFYENLDQPSTGMAFGVNRTCTECGFRESVNLEDAPSDRLADIFQIIRGY